jgi:hypothetical protein
MQIFRSTAILVLSACGTLTATPVQAEDQFSKFEQLFTEQLEIVGCKPSRGQPCRMAALRWHLPGDARTCVSDVISSQLYRQPDEPPFKAIPLVVHVTSPPSVGDGAFYKAIVSIAPGSETACIPRRVTVGSEAFDIAIWSDPRAVTPTTWLPVESAVPSLFSARLDRTRGAEAKGVLSSFFGPSYGANSIVVTITSLVRGLRIKLPEEKFRSTNTSFRVDSRALEQISVQVKGKWQPLSLCKSSEDWWRWNRTYRC